MIIKKYCNTHSYDSREADRKIETSKMHLVVQGILMKFECRFVKRMVWCISFDIWLCLNVVHSYGIREKNLATSLSL